MTGHVVAQRWPRWRGPSDLLRLSDHTSASSEMRVGTGPDPQVLVLVHAALLDRHMWSVVAQRLGAELVGDWRIVAYDLRGHGDARDAPPITGIDQLGSDLRDLVDALPARRAHVVGLSLGGAVAQAAALRDPELVASLTLVATSCRFPLR
jgi:3-oxoadipate enol-lactonase